MSKVFRPWKTDEVWLLPPSVSDFVPAGHPAHLIRDLVCEELDLSAIMGVYTEVRGYPPYHPAMMVALLLYAYRSGVYSSRRIAQACEERLDFQAVTALNQPDFRTISEFRRRHLDALAGLDHVSVDGTKIKANASKHKAMSYARMVKAEAELSREVAEWLARAQAEDAAEDAEHGSARRGDEPPDWMRDKQTRLARIRAAKAELEAEARAAEAARPPPPCHPDSSPKTRPGRPPQHPPGQPKPKAQRNFTDPESRIMKGRDGFIQAYNAQAGVDADAQIIVAHRLTNNGSDQDALLPLLDAAAANTGEMPKEVSADNGFCSEANLQGLIDRTVRGYVAAGRASTPDGGQKGGPLVQAMRTRLRQGGHQSRYRKRKYTVEPVFGHIKQARGFRQFLLRGIDKVRGEWAIICTAHNLAKLTA
jgi:transposase